MDLSKLTEKQIESAVFYSEQKPAELAAIIKAIIDAVEAETD